MSRIGRIAAAALLGAAAGLAAVPATAQTSTGRYAPEAARRPARFTLFAGAGVLTSGDVFSVDGATVQRWLTPGGTSFAAQRFTVTLDEDVETTLGLSYLVASGWRLRLDLAYGQMDMTALARTAEAVDLVRYDKLSAAMAAVAVEAALLSTSSYPYLLAGGVATSLSGDRTGDFDQTLLGLRGGIGFHWALDPSWGVRFEIRDTIHQIDTADHEVRLAGPGEAPAAEELGPQHFFEVGGTLGIAF